MQALATIIVIIAIMSTYYGTTNYARVKRELTGQVKERIRGRPVEGGLIVNKTGKRGWKHAVPSGVIPAILTEQVDGAAVKK